MVVLAGWRVGWRRGEGIEPTLLDYPGLVLLRLPRNGLVSAFEVRRAACYEPILLVELPASVASTEPCERANESTRLPVALVMVPHRAGISFFAGAVPCHVLVTRSGRPRSDMRGQRGV